MSDFHNILRRVRQQSGMTQTELAARAGLPPSAIAHLEHGRRKPSFDTLLKISRALSVTADYLMEGTGTKTVFLNTGKLSIKDYGFIQDLINVLVAKNEGGRE
jgi:transcriptional regulator with XRE-family HTH domain